MSTNASILPISFLKINHRDHHPELNQVVLNLITEHQAGIPLMMQAADGNQVDTQAFSTIVKSHIESLKSASHQHITLIADAALYTTLILKHLKTQKIDFISRIPMRLKKAKEFVQTSTNQTFNSIDENYSYIKQTLTYEDIPQQWILYRSGYTQTKQSSTIKKELLQKSLKEAKEIKRLTKLHMTEHPATQRVLNRTPRKGIFSVTPF
ncbi:IS1634 family transposase [Sulfurimonas sp. NW15]|uniref:IS1634 family transposase n=1 Tax=Sulfurimonas sp. NW15 TaxID=2922729 RepID=UPI003DA86582